ncbi:FtsX-like permease family protein [Bacteroidales bacterium OttesenSCG-928-B11]|nr:FtsX-like permease family protein [Bacteroidales bacterium OttesenSCG-928-E04]MDL2307969.1 FtsX-like permease family protein [Bacteroidales bacterium OttesenSCG-928-C03]MDL2311670.1 FtsX-like permease family protein [Bacteroidales bacterium OttesenSCG-928-B11]MDL2325759.1 FtsX-like permease family protein [Bacteroidales bacterium OttesenSCG-928-A14]
MIKQIFKIIWRERKNNFWVLFELMLAFVIINCCVLYLNTYFQDYRKDPGMDTTHTYVLPLESSIENTAELEYSDSTSYNEKLLYMLKAIRELPFVETAALSEMGKPYGGINRSYMIRKDDGFIIADHKKITPEYLDVFRIDVLKGSNFDRNSSYEEALISGTIKNEFPLLYYDNRKGSESIDIFQLTHIDGYDDELKVRGVVSPTKSSALYHIPVVYTLIRPDGELDLQEAEITIRVKPEADRHFIKKYKEQIMEVSNVYPFRISDVISSEELKRESLSEDIPVLRFKLLGIILFFVVANIFIGIIGSFWNKIKLRKKDIGLRLSLGATRGNIGRMCIAEALILLGISAVFGLVIFINIAQFELLPFLNFNITENSWQNFFENLMVIAVTLLFLSLTVVLAVWYPAWRAAKMIPRELVN